MNANIPVVSEIYPLFYTQKLNESLVIFSSDPDILLNFSSL